MCGRFVITSPPAAMRQVFGYLEQPNFPPRYNIAPTQPIPVVIVENGARHFRLMRWGLMPSWVKDPRKFTLLINARAETVLDKPAFRNAIKRRRCLVPADGYYEWQAAGTRKQPYFIHPRDGGRSASRRWRKPGSGRTARNSTPWRSSPPRRASRLAVLHDRVPVTIAPADFERWLDCAAVDAPRSATTLLRAPADGEFVWHPVSTAVNRVANDDAQLILPIAEEASCGGRAAAASRPKKAAPRKPAPPPADSGQGSLF